MGLTLKMTRVVTCLMVLLFVAWFIVAIMWKPEITYDSSTRFVYVDQSIMDQLYRMMFTVDNLFGLAGIEYWAEGGTLLGAVRSNGIIKWDDDVDIGMFAKDSTRMVEALKNPLDQLGYELIETWFGYKVYPKDGKVVEGHPWKYPSLDIFTMIPVDEDEKSMVETLLSPSKTSTESRQRRRIKYSTFKAQLAFGKCYLFEDELYPLRRVKFGNDTILIPREPNEYLNRCYGEDWSTHAYQQYSHELERPIQRVKLLLTDEERQPA